MFASEEEEGDDDIFVRCGGDEQVKGEEKEDEFAGNLKNEDEDDDGFDTTGRKTFDIIVMVATESGEGWINCFIRLK